MRYTAALVLTLLFAIPAVAADLNGKWKASMEGPDGSMELIFSFRVEAGQISGTVSGPMGDMPITEGKLEGDTISFTVTTDQFKVVHKGTVSGDEIKLNVEMGENTMNMALKRVKS